jgi:CheY-like chemotaxis protein
VSADDAQPARRGSVARAAVLLEIPPMENLDGAAFGKTAVQLQLLNETDLRQVLAELGDRNPPLEVLVARLERSSLLTPWQTARIKRGETDGFQLGGYRLQFCVDSGTFGRVYRADDPRDGRRLAVKVLRRKWSDDRNIIDLFLREGKLGLTLKNPNIVDIVAVNRDPVSNQYYIAMEFVEGGNLRQILQIRKRLKVAEALQILEEVTSGLAYAFSRGITHRDIKLSNLLISAQGHCKIVDFGLAQLFETVKNTRQEKDHISRTVDYAGLERTTGAPDGDARSDIYFLGCVLYEMLTGRCPLERSASRTARMQRSRFEEVIPIGSHEVIAPASVFLLAETMMNLNPSARYQTLSQLLDAIRAAQRDVQQRDCPPALTGAPEKKTTVFVVEKDDRLIDEMREGFKTFGYRVLITRNPALALQRFRQQPYDALVVDAGTTFADGREAFNRVLAEVSLRKHRFAGVMLLAEQQADWLKGYSERNRASAMMLPTKVRRIHRKIGELLAVPPDRESA